MPFGGKGAQRNLKGPGGGKCVPPAARMGIYRIVKRPVAKHLSPGGCEVRAGVTAAGGEVIARKPAGATQQGQRNLSLAGLILKGLRFI